MYITLAQQHNIQNLWSKYHHHHVCVKNVSRRKLLQHFGCIVSVLAKRHTKEIVLFHTTPNPSTVHSVGWPGYFNVIRAIKKEVNKVKCHCYSFQTPHNIFIYSFSASHHTNKLECLCNGEHMMTPYELGFVFILFWPPLLIVKKNGVDCKGECKRSYSTCLMWTCEDIKRTRLKYCICILWVEWVNNFTNLQLKY